MLAAIGKPALQCNIQKPGTPLGVQVENLGTHFLNGRHRTISVKQVRSKKFNRVVGIVDQELFGMGVLIGHEL
ncbi:MAG: hypothetical protein EA401_00245 [Planctomycetota bacterium]|nr:MAG: hypothetical protein EA401_00245 [Planctomycetota bacterium]